MFRRLMKFTSNDVVTLPKFLSPAECKNWIRWAEKEGFDSAPVTTALGPILLPRVRNNTRVMLDDVEAASDLWSRLLPLLPGGLRAEQPVGLNERFRFYRYDPGQRFAPHCDGYYARPDGSEVSRLTLLLYLNGDCLGGETRLISPVAREIRPETGSVLIFPHGFCHEGCEVFAGRKYVLRTDVMFRSG